MFLLFLGFPGLPGLGGVQLDFPGQLSLLVSTSSWIKNLDGEIYIKPLIWNLIYDGEIYKFKISSKTKISGEASQISGGAMLISITHILHVWNICLHLP